MMYGHEKSDPAIVAVKPANKAERSAAELAERRVGTKGNAGQLSTRRTQSRALAYGTLLPSIPEVGRGARGNSRPYRETLANDRLWHECDLRAAPINVRSWESNGLNADVAFGPFAYAKANPSRISFRSEERR